MRIEYSSRNTPASPRNRYISLILVLVLLILIAPTAATAQSQASTTDKTPNANTTSQVTDNQSLTTQQSNSTRSLETPPQKNKSNEKRKEPNDDYRTAPVVNPLSPTKGEIRNSNDIDWYQLNHSEGDRIAVEFTSGNTSNLSAFLYHEGALVDSSYAPPGTTVNLVEPSASTGVYYVAVQDVDGHPDEVGSYQFQISTEQSKQTVLDSGDEENGTENGTPIFLVILAVIVILLIASGAVLMRKT